MNRDIELLEAGSGLLVKEEHVVKYVDYLLEREQLPILIQKSIMKGYCTIRLSATK